jgi:hypothetical protein
VHTTREVIAMADSFDFKKEHRNLYQPSTTPSVIDVPEMIFIMVEGAGDPNTSASYAKALEILYGLSYTIKMSNKGDATPEGYFAYVVLPLEGLWWVDEEVFDGVNITDKEHFQWVSMIRQPDFVTPVVFERACETLQNKKPELDISRARLQRFTEGLCAQALHAGPFDTEPITVAHMDRFIEENGYRKDFSPVRHHHEIYLSDPRRIAPERMRTVIRHPIARI